MDSQIIGIDFADWRMPEVNADWIAALEAGKVLYFPRLSFELREEEKSLLRPDIR